MARREPTREGRLRSFRLTDLPLELRLAGADRARRQLGRGLSELTIAVQLENAARRPSNTVYRVPEQAWLDVVGQPE